MSTHKYNFVIKLENFLKYCFLELSEEFMRDAKTSSKTSHRVIEDRLHLSIFTAAGVSAVLNVFPTSL